MKKCKKHPPAPKDGLTIEQVRARNKAIKRELVGLVLHLPGEHPLRVEGFWMISRALLASRTLRPVEKIALAGIIDHVWDTGEGGAFPGIRRLSLLTGIPRSTLIESLNRLDHAHRILGRFRDGPSGRTEYYLRPLTEWRVDSVRKALRSTETGTRRRGEPREGGSRVPEAPAVVVQDLDSQVQNLDPLVQDPDWRVQDPDPQSPEAGPKRDQTEDDSVEQDQDDGERGKGELTDKQAARGVSPPAPLINADGGRLAPPPRNEVHQSVEVDGAVDDLIRGFCRLFVEHFERLPAPTPTKSLVRRIKANMLRLRQGGKHLDVLAQGVANLFAWWDDDLRGVLAWNDEAPNLSLIASEHYFDRVYAFGLRTDPPEAAPRDTGRSGPSDVIEVDQEVALLKEPKDWSAVEAAAYFVGRFRHEFQEETAPVVTTGLLRAIQARMDHLSREGEPVSEMRRVIDFVLVEWDREFLRERLKVESPYPSPWLIGGYHFQTLLWFLHERDAKEAERESQGAEGGSDAPAEEA